MAIFQGDKAANKYDTEEVDDASLLLRVVVIMKIRRVPTSVLYKSLC